MRIARKYPGIVWQRVWRNVHTTGHSDPIKSTWYAAIHEKIQTNERLAAIHLTTITSSARCGATDTLLHRLIACGEGTVIWTWTKTRIAAILLIHPKHIPGSGPYARPFVTAPPKRQAAIIWIVSHLVPYRLQTERRLSLTDYMDFLQRARCRVPPSTQDTHSRKVPGCAIIPPPHQHQIRLKSD